MLVGPRARLRLVAGLITVLACDPGFRFTPVGWTPSPEYRWASDFEGFALRTESLGGLVGDWWLYPRFQVLGNEEPVTIRSAVLRTVSGEYPGTIDRRVMKVPPGGGAFVVSWRFGEGHPAPEVLGDRATIVLELSVGTRPESVRVDYERTRCC